jgi:hypothetical protein
MNWEGSSRNIGVFRAFSPYSLSFLTIATSGRR